MILSFSGDPFLARRAALEALAERGLPAGAITHLGEGMSASDVTRAAQQGGLFGATALMLDFGEAFTGQAGVKPRNDTLRALAALTGSTLIVVLDPTATPARQRALRELGEHTHLPTPKYGALIAHAERELRRANVRFERGVPRYLADATGPNPAELASEITKLALLEGTLDVKRVRALLNRNEVRDSFDIIEAISAGDAPRGVRTARQLVEEGEAVPRIFGALTWQFMLVARASALLASSHPPRGGAAAARALGAQPFAAERALKLARRLRDEDLLPLLKGLLDADVRAKSGGDAELALESVIIELARRFER